MIREYTPICGGRKMKKCFAIFLTIVIIMSFSACSNNTTTTELTPKEGVWPYKLSESDTYLLKSLGLDANTNIVSLQAPKSAKSLEVNVYILGDNGTWNPTGGGAMSLELGDNPEASREGNVALLLKDNYAIDFNMNIMGGRVSYKVGALDAGALDAGALDADDKAMMSERRFLTDFQEIEINKEIPVAVMIYDSGNSMRGYEVADYFTPSKFRGMDVVQAVTLTFTDTAF
jgi:hypothetical protein